MKINKAVITAAGRQQRTLPLQTLIDRDGAEKSVLSILGQGLKKFVSLSAPAMKQPTPKSPEITPDACTLFTSQSRWAMDTRSTAPGNLWARIHSYTWSATIFTSAAPKKAVLNSSSKWPKPKRALCL